MKALTKHVKQIGCTMVKHKITTCFIAITILCLWANNALAVDPSTDILGASKGDITKNFGASSTVIYGVYIAEIFAGVAAYIKSKNLFALLGLVIVVIFTTVAFSLIGS